MGLSISISLKEVYFALLNVVFLSFWTSQLTAAFVFGCGSNLVAEGFLLDDSSYEEDGEIFDDMDM